MACFNPRARRGRDMLQAAKALAKARVSIHAPAGGATNQAMITNLIQSVSIHAPAGGATRYVLVLIRDQRVSIHAPAGGATRATGVPDNHHGSFNPRARRGRDVLLRPLCADECCFNPRARRGRDVIGRFIPPPMPVSIHAPAGGATFPDRDQQSGMCVSIHAPAGGATTPPSI